ncbi:nitroreductase family deazaflavin-dependent oxidoreductase [Phycicoccus sp. CMS6Z-2]|nr:nitroreductase family deazaflavin-dependent oxidoreductase [Phycicoccus flavus]
MTIARDCPPQARTIDITTLGRRSGRPRRIEMWFYRVDGALFLTTQPARRSWYANLLADPTLTVHVKHCLTADLPATALPVTATARRRRVFGRVLEDLSQYLTPDQTSALPPLEAWVEGSPLVEVRLSSDRAAILQKNANARGERP